MAQHAALRCARYSELSHRRNLLLADGNPGVPRYNGLPPQLATVFADAEVRPNGTATNTHAIVLVAACLGTRCREPPIGGAQHTGMDPAGRRLRSTRPGPVITDEQNDIAASWSPTGVPHVAVVRRAEWRAGRRAAA